MISVTPFLGKPAVDLPRRDLVAIFQYLNRKELDRTTKQRESDRKDESFATLAAASRMQ